MVGRGRVCVDGELRRRRGPRGRSATDLGAAFLTPPTRDDPGRRSTAGHAGRPPVRDRPRRRTRASSPARCRSSSAPSRTPSDPDAPDRRGRRGGRERPTSPLVVVGTNSMVESEGFDREHLALPGRQDDLVARRGRGQPAHGRARQRRLAGADAVARRRRGACCVGYFGGQEFGDAVADVLLGVAEPGGRLPTTWPAADEDVPVLSTHAGRRRRSRYTEGIHIGYRAWLKHDAAPAYWFGHGLGYTDIASTDVDGAGRRRPAARSSPSTVARRRTAASATASRSSRCTPSAPGSAVDRPVRWLVGFAPVRVPAGRDARPSTSRSRPGCSPTGPTAGPTSRAPTRCGSAPASSTCRCDDDRGAVHAHEHAGPTRWSRASTPTRAWSCVDGAYYLATSTFEYLPGMPVYRSTDLVEWTQIGNVATRPEQVGRRGRAHRRRRVGADDPPPRRRLLPHRHRSR